MAFDWQEPILHFPFNHMKLTSKFGLHTHIIRCQWVVWFFSKWLPTHRFQHSLCSSGKHTYTYMYQTHPYTCNFDHTQCECIFLHRFLCRSHQISSHFAIESKIKFQEYWGTLSIELREKEKLLYIVGHIEVFTTFTSDSYFFSLYFCTTPKIISFNYVIYFCSFCPQEKKNMITRQNR